MAVLYDIFAAWRVASLSTYKLFFVDFLGSDYFVHFCSYAPVYRLIFIYPQVNGKKSYFSVPV